MSVIFNLRPPQSKHVFAQNVQVVLNYTKSVWGCTGTLSHKELSLKLLILLALTTFSRASSLHCLNIRYMVNTGDKETFSLKLHKSWRKVNALPSVTICSYSADEELCLVKTHRRYLEVTEKRRAGKTRLLLCFKKPYR